MVEPRVVIKPSKTTEPSENENTEESNSDPSPPTKKPKLEFSELPEAKKKIEEEKKSQRQQLIKNLEQNSEPEKEPFVVYNFKGLPTFSNPIGKVQLFSS